RRRRHHAAGADRAAARSRPRSAPRPLHGAAVVLQYVPCRLARRKVRAAAGEAALLHAGRLAGLDLVEKALAMWSYILKRLLLMIPTLFGILLITFIVIQFVPGGPVEQMV